MTDNPVKDTGPLDWRIGIVDKAGRPTPEFQRRWATQRNNNALISAITFGSGAPTGMPVDGQEYVDTSATPYVLYVGKTGAWHKVGVTDFIELFDVPHTYVPLDLLRVNVGGTGLDFITAASLTANPTATASDTAVNGSASTYMRSDAAPAIQKGLSSQFGVVKVDGTTITSTAGVLSAAAGTGSAYVLKAGDTMSGPLVLAAGSTALPGLVFTGDTTTGMSAGTAGNWVFSSGGVSTITFNGTGILIAAPTGSINIASDGAANNIIARYSNNTTSPNYFLVKGRGTQAASLRPALNDFLGSFICAGINADGTSNNTQAARIRAKLIETGTVGPTAMGARLEISANAIGAGTMTDIAYFSTTGVQTLKPIFTTASVTTAAGLNLPHGTAPTSPTNGDIWTTTGGVYVRINGSTVGPLASATGSGTVTSVATGTGLTGGTITTTGTLSLASIADKNILSNISGSSAAPTANTATALLDSIFGSTQGMVLYRDASAWSALAPGASGLYLKTQGSGANPIWSAVGGGSGGGFSPWDNGAIVPPANGTFSAVYQGAGTKGDMTQSRGTYTKLTTPVNGDKAFLYVALPATPYTITALINFSMPGIGGFSLVGLGVSDGTKYRFAGYSGASTGSGASRWNIQGAATIGATSFTETPQAQVGGAVMGVPVWLRLNDNGTNLTWSISHDGDNWIQMNQESRTVFTGTPTRVGVMLSIEQPNSSPAAALTFIHSWAVT